jgi:serine/threonine protein kinase
VTEPPREPCSSAEPTASAEAARLSALPLDASEALDVHDRTTGHAPSFRSLLPATDAARPTALPVFPSPGQRLHDFDLLRVLGQGAFAMVYLARQVSLDRQVALKISANRGSEARTLASLEHDHIVRVFSQDVDPPRNLRLVCMQYVCGTTLERVIHTLGKRPRAVWSGAAILEAIDKLSPQPAELDAAALRDREHLAAADFVESVCWIGARLAEALAHAHTQGVLHRDVKPANILLNRYGRPFLADFNVALDPQRMRGPAGEVFGGTLAYMAPEHVDAFNPDMDVSPAVVDARSDMYSLGLVLFELLTGRLPFPVLEKLGRTGELLRDVAALRRSEAPSPRSLVDVPETLDRVVRRCLDPRPEERYQTADELAHALDGCGQHRRMMKALPVGGPLTRAVERHPFWMGAALLFLPHVLGSVVNISYNAVRIVGELTQEQRSVFNQLVAGYNIVVYPLCLVLMWLLVAPLFRGLDDLAGRLVPHAGRIAVLRRRLLRLPRWAVVIALAGWLPGGLLFPLGIDRLAGPIDASVYLLFVTSFAFSGLIALTYSVFGLEFLVLRVLYPRYWVDAQDLRTRAPEELHGEAGRVYVLQLLAVLTPLAMVVAMVWIGPEQEIAASGFRVLLMGLSLLAGLGYIAALSAGERLDQAVQALTGERSAANR